MEVYQSAAPGDSRARGLSGLTSPLRWPDDRAVMLGFGGLGDIVFIFFLAMLIFGPEKLPEIGRMLAKGMAEVRKASNELKRTLNAELAVSEQEIEARRQASVQAAAAPFPAAQPAAPLVSEAHLAAPLLVAQAEPVSADSAPEAALGTYPAQEDPAGAPPAADEPTPRAGLGGAPPADLVVPRAEPLAQIAPVSPIEPIAPESPVTSIPPAGGVAAVPEAPVLEAAAASTPQPPLAPYGQGPAPASDAAPDPVEATASRSSG
jgi:Sec-independent protein translocase protein TatA